MRVYKFNKETLDFEPISFKPVLIIPLFGLLGICFYYFFFFAAIFNDTDWRGEEIKITGKQKMNNYFQQLEYKRQETAWLNEK